MARYKDSKCKLCRREGVKLFLKGTRCITDKCAVTRREYAPGQHGQKRVKLSDYGVQMREKQKAKRIYGILERQFRRYFKIASRSKGVTGQLLLQMLERRLDNVLFRMGISTSRQTARQIVRQSPVYVNGRKVNIPSYMVKTGDIVTLKPKEGLKKRIADEIEFSKERPVPPWLEVDHENLKATIKRLPAREDIGYDIKEQLIVELYSK